MKRAKRLLVAWVLALPIGFDFMPMVRGESTMRRPSLRDVLSEEEFREAGLAKLSEKQLEYLDRILAGHGFFTDRNDGVAEEKQEDGDISHVAKAGGTAGNDVNGERRLKLAGAAAFGLEDTLKANLEKELQIPKEIRSRLLGEFKGWSGGTLFHLENGQIWKQIDDARFSVRLKNPEVVIRKGAFGSFFLRVAGYGSTVKVSRVK